jgi:hypothetical protein
MFSPVVHLTGGMMLVVLSECLKTTPGVVRTTAFKKPLFKIFQPMRIRGMILMAIIMYPKAGTTIRVLTLSTVMFEYRLVWSERFMETITTGIWPKGEKPIGIATSRSNFRATLGVDKSRAGTIRAIGEEPLYRHRCE